MKSRSALFFFVFLLFVFSSVFAQTPQPLPFSQDWTNTAQITANDNWSGVPGIIGYLGSGLASATGVNPQTILVDGTSTPVDVNANITTTFFATGGVSEMEITNPTIALQGSGTARAPFILIGINSLGYSNVQVSYNLRDIDPLDNAVQQVALHYRVGSTGNFTNIPAGFVADATEGPGLATKVTPVNVTLPPDAGNQAVVQIRIMTTDAVGSDELVGIDDILIVGGTNLSVAGVANPSTLLAGGSTLLTATVTPASIPTSTGIGVTADLSSIGGLATQQFYDDGTNGDVTAGDNVFSFQAVVANGTAPGTKSLPVQASDAQGRTASASIMLTVESPPEPVVVLISEFRVRGPLGGNDEFIELYNPTNIPVDIGTWKVKGSNSSGTVTVRATIPAGTFLMPGQYYLLTNGNSPGYSGPVPGDQTYMTGITDDGGIAITLPNDAIVDQIGLSLGSAFKEGTPLASLGSSNQNRSYERKPGGSDCNGTDTDNNASDFQLISPSNPQNRTSFCDATALSASGSADPSTVTAGGTTLLTVNVKPGSEPPSTGINVTGDLSSIGGLSSQSFFDNGMSGDAASGDNIFSFQATVAVGTAAGTKSLPVSVSDAEGRSASAAISLTVEVPVVMTPIHDIQGNGSASPFTGQLVTTGGIVTGLKSNGFFIQTPESEADSDPNTSEGVFVFTSSSPPSSAAVGNLVTVRATVVEFIPSADPFSPPLTELSISPVVTLISSGNPLPAPAVLTSTETSPLGSIEQLERFEGMRVQANSLTVVGPTQGSVNEPNATSTSNGVFYGVVTGVARPFREPGIEVPDPLPSGAPAGIPRFDANPERLRVDSDGQPGGMILNVASGATVTNLVGPLDYSFRTYTVLPDSSSPPSVLGDVSATAVSDPLEQEVTVGTFNMQRFFDTVNDPSVGEPVLTVTAFNNRLNKASLAIRQFMKTPDVIGVVEVENLSTLQSIATKVNGDAVAAGNPSPGYMSFLMEGNDIGGIDVGFLVKGIRVTVLDVAQEGKDATFINPLNGQPELLNDRPPLVLRAEIQRPSTPPFPFTVIVVHQRSLNGVDDAVDGPRVRAKRKAQAEFLANLIQARQTANPNEQIIAVGDYNAFQFNDGYVDVMGTVLGTPTPAENVVSASPDLVNPDFTDLIHMVPADQRYSFVFDGNAQELDHIIVNQPLLSRVSKIEYARTNSDFPDVHRNDPTRAERLSDHDPAVAYIMLPPLNHAPIANAGEDQTVECTGHEGTQVTLDGSGSTDEDGDSLVYIWKKNGETVAGPSGSPMTVLSLDLGTHEFELVVDDLSGGIDADTVAIHVADTTPPAVSIVMNPAVLWPPNHKFVDVKTTVSAKDTCDEDPAVVLVSITNNEGAADAVQEAAYGTADFDFQLLAERSGKKKAGRVYTVVYQATDETGNSVRDSATVTVPHSMASEAAASDVAAIEIIPTEFSVGQNYPNPFNPTTVFRFGLPVAKRVTLKIYNIIGEEVAVLVNGDRPAGFQTVEWNAVSLPSGMYIYRFVAGDFVETRKLLLVK